MSHENLRGGVLLSTQGVAEAGRLGLIAMTLDRVAAEGVRSAVAENLPAGYRTVNNIRDAAYFIYVRGMPFNKTWPIWHGYAIPEKLTIGSARLHFEDLHDAPLVIVSVRNFSAATKWGSALLRGYVRYADGNPQLRGGETPLLDQPPFIRLVHTINTRYPNPFRFMRG